ncbi:MAG: hypothetical protein CMJ58_05305 [Planctomycetaceae bacterium]|nr:hypothetical protein [Planctomycetaceae bacterium]
MAKKDTQSATEPDLVVTGRDGSQYIFVWAKQAAGESDAGEVDFADQLRAAIEKSGVSQYQLAKVADVPQTAISKFLRGNDIRLSTFNRLANVMGFELKHKPSKMPKTKKPAKKSS